MINLRLDPASVDEVQDYLEVTRTRILAAIRSGMGEAMQALAYNVADKFSGNPIVSRSGDLLGGILGSPHVSETNEVIRGTVSAIGADGKPVGLWLEEGTHVEAVDGTLFQFTEADEGTFYSRGHRAFDVKPHPFMNPSLREMKQPIMDIIAARLSEALAQ